ncbi:hypothetical protein DSUL_230002 [Desulfovibrionales bacterium]
MVSIEICKINESIDDINLALATMTFKWAEESVEGGVIFLSGVAY